MSAEPMIAAPAVSEPAPEARLVRGPARIMVCALVAIAALLPVVTSTYWLGVLVLAAIYAVVAQAWNLVMGVAGIWWFAQIAVFAIGAYADALLMVKLHVPGGLALVGGTVAGLVAGLAIGLPASRLRGVYVVLFTLAVQQGLWILVSTDGSGFTGGTFGLYGFDAFGLGGKSADTRVTVFFYGALLLLVVSSFVIHRVISSPLGLALRTLREAEPYAVARGVDRRRAQMAVFGASSLLTGLAGAFYADYFGATSPTIFSFNQTTLLLAMIVIGGWATFWGPIIGAFVVTIVSEQLRDIESTRLLIFAAWAFVMIVYVPGGLVGMGRIWARGRRRLDGWLEDA